MNTINAIEVAVTVTEPFTAQNYRLDEFTVDQVRWRTERGYTVFTLHGYTADGTRTDATRFPRAGDDITRVPHPGLWFDELAKQIAGQVTR